MILSDKIIADYLARGKINIFPEFDPADIRPTGIRLHVGSELLIPVKAQIVDLDSNQDME
jgi:deoxycytidine triphosphate deaminase